MQRKFDLGLGLSSVLISGTIASWFFLSKKNNSPSINTSLFTTYPSSSVPSTTNVTSLPSSGTTMYLTNQQIMPSSEYTVIIMVIIMFIAIALLHFLAFALQKSNYTNIIRTSMLALSIISVLSILGYVTGLKSFNDFISLFIIGIILYIALYSNTNNSLIVAYLCVALIISIITTTFVSTIQKASTVPISTYTVYVTGLLLVIFIPVLRSCSSAFRDQQQEEMVSDVVNFVLSTILATVTTNILTSHGIT